MEYDDTNGKRTRDQRPSYGMIQEETKAILVPLTRTNQLAMPLCPFAGAMLGNFRFSQGRQ